MYFVQQFNGNVRYFFFFVEIKSEFSAPFQVGGEKAFLDVNNSNCISFKCCGIRTAMLLWSFVQFPFSISLRLGGGCGGGPTGLHLSPSSFPFSVVFHSYSKVTYLLN